MAQLYYKVCCFPAICALIKNFDLFFWIFTKCNLLNEDLNPAKTIYLILPLSSSSEFQPKIELEGSDDNLMLCVLCDVVFKQADFPDSNCAIVIKRPESGTPDFNSCLD